MTHHEILSSLAYVDPGTGTLALQMLIAGIAGGLVMLRNRIAALFGRKKERTDKSE